MNISELNNAWERLEGLRQSYTFRPFTLRDMEGRETTLDRLINRFQILWGDFLESGEGDITSEGSARMAELRSQYVFANRALNDAIAMHGTNKGRDVASGQGFDIMGRVTPNIPSDIPATKRASNHKYIFALVIIGIAGTIGLMQSKKRRRV